MPASQVGQGARYGPSSSFNTRTSVASSSINLRGSDRSPPAPSASDTNFYPGDPNDWSKEDDDHLHNFDPKDRKVSFLFFLFARNALPSVSKEYPSTVSDKETGNLLYEKKYRVIRYDLLRGKSLSSPLPFNLRRAEVETGQESR